MLYWRREMFHSDAKWNCVVPENIHTTPTEGICRMTPVPFGFSKIGPQNLPHLPTGISKILALPLEILLSLIEVNKEVVLFTRMPNFVSFVYFLLNCITDKWIPYANSLCAQVTDKFCAFHVISVEFYNSANEMQGRVGNITVLFSHCVKKKATLNTWRSIIKEIRTSSRDKTVWVSNSSVADFIDKKIVTRSWTCWKRLVYLLCDRETAKRRRNATNLKNIFFVFCVLDMQGKWSFVPLAHKLQKRKR